MLDLSCDLLKGWHLPSTMSEIRNGNAGFIQNWRLRRTERGAWQLYKPMVMDYMESNKIVDNREVRTGCLLSISVRRTPGLNVNKFSGFHIVRELSKILPDKAIAPVLSELRTREE